MVSPSIRTGMVVNTSIIPSAAGTAHSVSMNSIAPGYQHFKYTIKKFSNHKNPLNSWLNSFWNRSTSNTSHGRLLAMYASSVDW